MTLLTAGALTHPATASNECTTNARLMTSAGCPPPNRNPGYAGVLHVHIHVRDEDDKKEPSSGFHFFLLVPSSDIIIHS